MKLVAKSSLVALVALAVTLGTYEVVQSHCEIPCGIYGDQTRIALFYEDIATVEKSMTQIMALQSEAPLNYNQIVRWVNNKEEHASRIQHVATQYFMTQRIKSANPKYVAQLTAMHGILVHAMKAKQTTDVAHCKHLRDLVDKFAEAYFSPEDLKHIRSHHKG
ncbi:MAG: superoxide dismutase [Planctomycetes bacterium]|nr:superoxide dismutase [Planctomycetota bacterium]